MDRYDVIIIGAGINGLVSAACLAKAGRSVIVLRAPGNASADYTAGWRGADGFDFPTPASHLENFPRRLVQDLGLEGYGLRPGAMQSPVLVSPSHGALVRDVDHNDMVRRLREISSHDADAYTDYISFITRQKRYLNQFVDLNGGAMPERRDLLPLLASAGQDGMWEGAHLAASSMKEVLGRRFQSEALKTLLFATTLGGYFGGMGLGPMAPTSATGLLMDPRSLGEDAQGLGYGPVEGGGAALLVALEKAAMDLGVTFADDTEVSEIVHEKGEVKGVALEGGQFIETSTLIGDVDFKVLFLSMFAWKALPHDFVLSVAASRNRALVAQVNFVLDGLPEISGLPEEFLRSGAPLFVMDDLTEVEQAHDAWTLHAIPENPPVEFRFHGTKDGAEDGAGSRNYATAYVYYIPGDLAIGEWSDEHKIRLISTVVNRIVGVSPGFEKSLIDAKLVLPVDYEERFGLVGGHLFGANTALDQTLFNRPNPEMAAGTMPLKGIYFAGPATAEAPFADGLTGLSVAQRILAEPRRGPKTQSLPVQWTRALVNRIRLAS